MAGIKSAIDLHKNGVTNTLILEARDRLGGRLFSIPSQNSSNPEIKYDLGALWFHDGLNNPLFDKAIAKGNVDYYFDDGDCAYLSKDHRSIDPAKFQQVLEEIQIYSQYIYEKHPDKQDISLKQLSQEYVDKYRNHLTDTQMVYSTGVLRMWAELWQGESWDKISAKYAFDGEGHLGRNAFVKNGYRTVYDNELNELPSKYQKENILLNTQVHHIDYSSPKKIVLTTRDNKRYSCDYLISTIPQSLYKITNPSDPCHIKWTPELPRRFSSVIPHIHFGSLGKVVLEFDECFWPKDIDRFYAISSQQNVSHTQPRAWDYPLLFVNYQKLANTPTLVALTQNPLSRYIENLSGAEKNDKIWSLFQPVLKQFASTDKIPSPNNIFHTTWSNDKFTRGAYGAAKVGTIDPQELNAPFIEGIQDRIRFAGAEIIDNSSNGCAHGAWFTGEREAKKILDTMRTKKAKF